MTVFTANERIPLPVIDSSMASLIECKLKQVKSITTSAGIRFLKIFGDELWSCQADGITVYDITLKQLRHMELDFTNDAALLSHGNIVIAGHNFFKEITKTGTLAQVKRS